MFYNIQTNQLLIFSDQGKIVIQWNYFNRDKYIITGSYKISKGNERLSSCVLNILKFEKHQNIKEFRCTNLKITTKATLNT